jgi:hypothetical protein
MWSRNLNRENGGKRRIRVPRRKKGRKKEEKHTERKNGTRDVHLWMLYPNKS